MPGDICTTENGDESDNVPVGLGDGAGSLHSTHSPPDEDIPNAQAHCSLQKSI